MTMLTAGRIGGGVIAGGLFSCAIIRGGFAVVSRRWPQTPPANLKIAIPGASAALFSQERLHMHGLRFFSVSTGKNTPHCPPWKNVCRTILAWGQWWRYSLWFVKNKLHCGTFCPSTVTRLQTTREILLPVVLASKSIAFAYCLYLLKIF